MIFVSWRTCTGIDKLDPRTVTAEGFKDTAMVAIDIHKLKEEDQHTNTYDYDSDSDLEVEEDEYGLSVYVVKIFVNCSEQVVDHVTGLILSRTLHLRAMPTTSKTYRGDRKTQRKLMPRYHLILCLSTTCRPPAYCDLEADFPMSREVQATSRTRFLRVGRVLVIRDTAFRTYVTALHANIPTQYHPTVGMLSSATSTLMR